MASRAEAAAWAAVLACGGVALLLRARLAELAAYESSPIDWCESNYAVHDSVAEFWNSVSSVPISLAAPAIYARNALPRRIWAEIGKVRTMLALVFLIGIGSVYFHATLSVVGQIMDEMTIIWLVLYSALFILPRNRYRRLTNLAFSPPFVLAFAMFTTLLGLFAPVLSHVFVLSCVPFGLYSFITAFRRSKNEAARERFRVALRLFGAAWGCWLLDKFFCTEMQLIGQITGVQPQLHAVWHCLVSAVAFLSVRVCSEFREEFQHGYVPRSDSLKGLEVV